MIAAATTTKYAFDLRPGDVYWCAKMIPHVFV